ncbi:YfcE family phosphodiesterase [Patescibacteria group bacterium]|nr:YfcE family phosphodiesterase [Patescibacteria group bacterium]
MNVGIISDTHNQFDNLRRALIQLEKMGIERLYHCGDWTTREAAGIVVKASRENKWLLRGIVGNMDPTPNALFEEFLGQPNLIFKNNLLFDETESGVIAVHHGDKQAILKEAFTKEELRFVFSGHTHQPEIKSVGKLLLVNPGSICAPPNPNLPGSMTCIWLDLVTRENLLISLKEG